MSVIPQAPHVRRATARDLEQILAIESAWPTTPHWNRSHFEAELGSKRGCLCAMERGGDVVGYASMTIIAPEAQLLNIAVRPDKARRGYGKKLMEYLHGEALRAGCSKIILEVSEKNAPAMRFYRHSGYQIVGRRSKYYNDGSDALLMEAPL